MIRKVASIVALTVFVSASYADDVKVAEKAATAAKVCNSKECAGCPVEAALAKLPKMSYLVGKEETCCAKSAATLAKKQNTAVKYVVAKKTFEDEGKAMLALAEVTDQFVNDFTTPKECKVSGKVTVAGKELCCEVMAGQRAKLATDAMKKVEMAYLVGGKQCACPVEADKLAKESNAPKVFLVAG